MKILKTNINIEELLPYREFDREANPAPRIPFCQMYNVDEVRGFIEEGGTIEPLELSVFEDKALLTDGNHRIAALKQLGVTIVEVLVTYYDTIEELSTVFYPQTVSRFKCVN